MPRSKRTKVASLTAVQSEGKERKERLIGKLQQAAERFTTVFLFRVSNSRTQVMQDVREHWRDSKIFLGKNKVMQVALGRSAAEEHVENIHLLSARLTGSSMLLFTNRERAEVETYFSELAVRDFARMGMMVTQDVVVKAGPLEQFAHSQEPYLRQLGLPTRLQKAVVVLERDFRLCEKGAKLTAEQAKLLKAFGMQLAESSFILDSMWHRGEFEQIGAMDLGEDDDDDDEEMVEVNSGDEEEGDDEEEGARGGNDNNQPQQFVFVRE